MPLILAALWKLWTQPWKTDSGRSSVSVASHFETFSEFVLLPSPSGLGVQSIKHLRFLRQLLIDGGHYAEWVEVMERTLRPRGRPRKTLANGDDFCRCYPYPRTRNSRDYMLLALKRHHPEELLSLSKTKGVIRDAAIKVGVIMPARRNGLHYGVCDIEAAKRLHEATKPKLLKDLFRELGVDAQCTFIKGLETGLGPGSCPALAGTRGRPAHWSALMNIQCCGGKHGPPQRPGANLPLVATTGRSPPSRSDRSKIRAAFRHIHKRGNSSLVSLPLGLPHAVFIQRLTS